MPEGGRRARNGSPKRIERRVKTRKTDDSNRFQKSRFNNHQQRTATTLKFNKFLGKLFDSGELKAFVKAELPIEEADHAYSGSIAGNPGKLIIRTKEFRPPLGRF